MAGRFYVTTPIYYLNGPPHLGHAYTTVAADALARWHRLNGRDVHFLTGTDEHGQKVLRAAEKLGRSPQAHVDALVAPFRALWDRLDIAYDDFVRTTEPRHVAFVQDTLARLHAEGWLYPDHYSGWYSTSAERFWTTAEVAEAAGVRPEDVEAGTAAGRCPDTGGAVEWLTEKNWFFRMGSLRERLLEHLEANPSCIRPENRRNEVLGFLRGPLGDLCISRPAARMAWGIPLPFDPDYVTYVWFDALTNYVSALGEHAEAWWPADVHLVGKDILTFHTVYWFTMLMAMGLVPPRMVYAHGWWLVDHAKMSKSVGNVVEVGPLIDRFGADAVRYYLLADIPFGGDGEFDLEHLRVRHNADLANDLGNLAHRALSMTERWFGGRLPPPGTPTDTDSAFLSLGRRAVTAFAAEMDALHFKQALEALWEFVRAGNKYVDQEAPWALQKRGDTARCGTVLRNTLECVRIAASHLACVCPRKSAELLTKLSLSGPDLRAAFDVLPAHASVAAGEPLFPRLDDVPPPHPEPPVPDPAPPTEPSPTITYDDFAKVNLRTGVVLAAVKHPKADRLLVLTVDVGEHEPRTIVAGIAKVHPPESLVGKRIVVVVNLAPVNLRGVVSQGMLLAAGGSDVCALLSPEGDVPPGSVVK